MREVPANKALCKRHILLFIIYYFLFYFYFMLTMLRCCLERDADCLHMVQLMPLPSQNLIISLPHLNLNPDWFYLSGTGLPRLSMKRGR